MNTAAIQTDWVGRVIDGKFTLLDWLGGSEAGAAFLTEVPVEPPQRAVIKLTPADAAGAEVHAADWKTATALSHPHLMRLLDSGRCQVDGEALRYAVTDYAEENLSQVLIERPLTPAETAEMLDPVLDALAYLHGKGLVHSHLKPSNIMVVEDQVKISSDGLHRAGESALHTAAPGVYDAPESTSAPIGPSADLWALGVTLVEALSQRPPLCDNPGQADPLVPESIPQPFAGIARDCLRSDPARRCTVSEIKARLHPEARLPVPPRSTPLSVPPPMAAKAVPAKGRLSRIALIAAAVVLLALAAGFLLRSRHAEPGFPEDKKLVLSPGALPRQSQALEAENSGGAAAKGAVAARVMPDILPAATGSIHGQFDVTVRVNVNAQGAVASSELDAPAPSKYFARQAIAAARQWRFEPARADGKPIASIWLLDFRFSRTSTEVIPVETLP